MEKMKKQVSRYEFRVFGKDFKRALNILSNVLPISENIKSTETYIILKNDEALNIKIRANTLEIKTLLERINSFEKWEPVLKVDFPLKKELLEKEVLPKMKLDKTPIFNNESCCTDELLQILKKEETIKLAKVKKERTKYLFDSVLCEAADIELDDRRFITICAESANIYDLESFITFLKLEKLENTNYVKMIQKMKKF